MKKRIVSIEADKVRNLKFGVNGMVEVEKELGKPVTELEKLSITELRKLFYVGLKWEDKEITFDSTGEIMDEIIENHGIEYLSEKLKQAIEGTFGKTPSPENK